MSFGFGPIKWQDWTITVNVMIVAYLLAGLAMHFLPVPDMIDPIRGIHHSFRWYYNSILASIQAGIFEEVLFRGLIFGSFVYFGKKWIVPGAIVSSLLFGFAHYPNYTHPVSQVIVTTILGLGFCGVRIKTKSIWWGVIAHIIIDLFALLQA